MSNAQTTPSQTIGILILVLIFRIITPISVGTTFHRLAIACRASQTVTGWVARTINPAQMGVVGSQALVAFQNSKGSMITYTTSISSYNPTMLPGVLSFQLPNISAEYAKNEMIIFAVLGPLTNGTRVNHVQRLETRFRVMFLKCTRPPNQIFNPLGNLIFCQARK